MSMPKSDEAAAHRRALWWFALWMGSTLFAGLYIGATAMWVVGIAMGAAAIVVGRVDRLI